MTDDWLIFLMKWRLDLSQLIVNSFEFSSTRLITYDLFLFHRTWQFFFLIVIEKKKDCRSTFEKNILIFHLKKNAGWICPLGNSYQKKCKIGCWVHKFEFEIERIQSSHFFFLILKKQNLLIEWLKKKMKLNLFVGVIEIRLIKWQNKFLIGKLI